MGLTKEKYSNFDIITEHLKKNYWRKSGSSVKSNLYRVFFSKITIKYERHCTYFKICSPSRYWSSTACQSTFQICNVKKMSHRFDLILIFLLSKHFLKNSIAYSLDVQKPVLQNLHKKRNKEAPALPSYWVSQCPPGSDLTNFKEQK